MVKKFPKQSLIVKYQIRQSIVLTLVPVACSLFLLALLYCFGQLNLFYLENSGLIINSQIRQAYHDQLQLELFDVSNYLFFLYAITFAVSYVTMVWATSPFVNAERTLRTALKNNGRVKVEARWMSESPQLMNTIQRLVMRLRDRLAPFEKETNATYKFNFRFFFKFSAVFIMVSIATGFIMGIVLGTAYSKIVNLAITLVGMGRSGYYFVAQQELLTTGVTLMTYLSGAIFAVVGIQITRYLSNMVFVFERAIKLHHFPLKLRDSDVYHGLADAISEVAHEAGLSKEKN